MQAIEAVQAIDAPNDGDRRTCGLALARHKQAEWLRFLADVRAQDAAQGGPRMRSTKP